MKTLIPFCLLAVTSVRLLAQQPPHACQPVKVTSYGTAVANVSNRVSAAYSGNVAITVNASCDPNSESGPRPGGLLTLNFAAGDSGRTITATSVAQLISTGGAVPAAYMSGPCQVQTTGGTPASCHYWIMFAQVNTNPTTGPAIAAGTQASGIVGLRVVDGLGKPLVYGAGLVGSGRISVTSPGY